MADFVGKGAEGSVGLEAGFGKRIQNCKKGINAKIEQGASLHTGEDAAFFDGFDGFL